MPLNLQDAALNVTGSIASSGTTANTGSINLGLGPFGELATVNEFVIGVPAQTVTQLPNTITFTYDVIASASANLSTPTVIYPSIVVQTGAGGVGAAASTVRFRLPLSPGGVGTSLNYVGVRATISTGQATAGAVFTLSPVF